MLCQMDYACLRKGQQYGVQPGPIALSHLWPEVPWDIGRCIHIFLDFYNNGGRRRRALKVGNREVWVLGQRVTDQSGEVVQAMKRWPVLPARSCQVRDWKDSRGDNT